MVSKKNFKVMHVCASTGYGVVIGKGESLEDAIRIAEEFEKQAIIDGYYIECGICFTDDEIEVEYINSILEGENNEKRNNK